MPPPNPCPVAFATRVIGGKWKPRIVWALIRTERLRFSALRRTCPPISDRILSRELKELEAAGLVVFRLGLKSDYTRVRLQAAVRTPVPIKSHLVTRVAANSFVRRQRLSSRKSRKRCTVSRRLIAPGEPVCRFG